MAKTHAALYRMEMSQHVCPYGLKSRHLLRSQGFEVEDHILDSREAVEAFKAEHGVKTTPQTFIGGERIGGYEALEAHLGVATAQCWPLCWPKWPIIL
jgi:glutaredoxin